MKSLSLPRQSRALVIVAHPDDETIWLGGLLLMNPQVAWTILALSRASDKDRAPKFKQVAKHYGARGIILDGEDDDRFSLERSVRQAEKLIVSTLGNEHFDWLFTHGQNGEYEHLKHIACHRAVSNLLAGNRLSVGAAFAFHYKKISKYKLAPKAKADIVLKLTPKIFKAKLDVMSKIYGFDPDGIDANYCTSTEALVKIKV